MKKQISVKGVYSIQMFRMSQKAMNGIVCFDTLRIINC